MPSTNIGASSSASVTIDDLANGNNSPNFESGKTYTFTLKFSDGRILTATGLASLSSSSSIITVSSSNMQGWQFIQESGSSGSASMVSGPNTPPLGIGSANFILNNSNDGWALLLSDVYDEVRLDDITKL